MIKTISEKFKLLSQPEELSEFENENESKLEKEKKYEFSSLLFPNMNLPLSLSSSNFSLDSASPQCSNEFSFLQTEWKSEKENKKGIEKLENLKERPETSLFFQSLLKSVSESVASPMLNPLYLGVLFMFINLIFFK
jgi:hypothetical protein